MEALAGSERTGMMWEQPAVMGTSAQNAINTILA
jgi:hypothetical protein